MKHKIMYSTPYYYVVDENGQTKYKSQSKEQCENKVKELEVGNEKKWSSHKIQWLYERDTQRQHNRHSIRR